MERYIHSEKIDVEKVVDEVFNFSRLGGVSISNVLTLGAREELLAAMRESQNLFKDVERETKSGVIQEMKTLYLEGVVEEELPATLTQCLRTLTAEYNEVYQRIAEAAHFTVRTFNSVGMHWYPVGFAGITPHQDYAADSNLITSFVIAGNAPFFICRDRQKTDAIQLDAEPGAIIFMRATRYHHEQPYRPFHYLLGPMEVERYSILVRNRTEAKMDQLKTEL
ncbi:MAG: hypothetical protein AABX82_03305 [Nanoarchaeota archaeon]